MYKKNIHIHFVGIGGIGMSGIAELLINLGYHVSGSDLQSSETTKRLQSLGANIYLGHDAKSINGADVIVTSSAIHSKNPEVTTALENHIPVIKRAEMLAELMRLKKFGIGVAGSHGKTSTTSLVSWLLYKAGLDPTVVIGGKVDSLGGNAKLGEGEFLIAEADESDGSFLKLSPVIEIITNIDLEHLDYYRNLDHIKDVFLEFIDKIPFYGAAIICLDDTNIVELLPKIRKRIISYGLNEQADVHAVNISSANRKTTYTVCHRNKKLGQIQLHIPGIHNIYNSLAAVALGIELEIDFKTIAQALASFEGVQRRIQVKGKTENILFVDDYGHHPTEIRATLQAIREGWPERRLVVLFQPHRYSRTKALFDEFKTAFHRADVLVLTDIYGASEEPIDGVHSKNLLSAITEHGQKQAYYMETNSDLADNVLKLIENGDLVLTLGAGNIVSIGENILSILNQRQNNLI